MQYPERLGEAFSPPIEVAKPFWELKQEIARMGSINPDGSLNVPDEFQAAFHQAFAPRLGDNNYPFLNSAQVHVLQHYPERSGVNIGHNNMRAAQSLIRRDQRYFLKHFGVSMHYPSGMDDPDAWTYVFDEVEKDPEKQRLYLQDLDFNTQTNIYNRYALPWAAAALLGYSGQPHNLIDIGCSQRTGLNMWALPRKYWPWKSIEVVDRTARREQLIPNLRATRELLRLLHVEMPLQHGIGIDIQNPDDPELKEFAFDCLYPKEYRDSPETEFDLRILSSTQFSGSDVGYIFKERPLPLPKVDFHQADIKNFDHASFRGKYPGFQADVIVFSTVAHQLGPDGMQQAEQNVEQYMTDGSTIFTLDFIDRIEPDGKFTFAKDWDGFKSYKLFAQVGRDQPRQHLFTAENGRVPRIIIEEAAAELALHRGFNLRPVSA